MPAYRDGDIKAAVSVGMADHVLRPVRAVGRQDGIPVREPAVGGIHVRLITDGLWCHNGSVFRNESLLT